MEQDELLKKRLLDLATKADRQTYILVHGLSVFGGAE